LAGFLFSQKDVKTKSKKSLTETQSFVKVKTSKEDFERKSRKHSLEAFLEFEQYQTNDGEEPATACKMVRNGKCSFSLFRSKERENLN
jgi:hypothetical protein